MQDLISDVCASALESNGTNALLHRETNRAVGRAQHSIIIEYYIICRVCRERGDLTISLHFPVPTHTHTRPVAQWDILRINPTQPRDQARHINIHLLCASDTRPSLCVSIVSYLLAGTTLAKNRINHIVHHPFSSTCGVHMFARAHTRRSVMTECENARAEYTREQQQPQKQ